MSNQIFISYRRRGGDITAKLICEALKNHGYTVFYDYDSLKGGFFDERILEAIDQCSDVVLVLPKHALKRCKNRDDWLRREIQHALKQNKKIIPVMMENFEFPKILPPDIQDVSRCNGVRFHMDCFDAVIDQIIDKLSTAPASPSPSVPPTSPVPPMPSVPPTSPVPPTSSTQRQKTNPSDAFTRNETKTKPRTASIRNVCSHGSCDFNNVTAADSYYSDVINRDDYNVIYFQLSTSRIPNKSEVKVGMSIYNSKNQKVYDDISTFEWRSNYDTAWLSWVIRGQDNSFVNADVYRAEFWIEDSEIYEYTFRITASTQNQFTRPQPETPPTPEQKPEKPRYFVALLQQIIFSVSLMLAFTAASVEEILPTLLLFAVAIFLFLRIFRFTKKHVTKNGFLAFLLVVILGFYYAIYLLVSGVAELLKRVLESLKRAP